MEEFQGPPSRPLHFTNSWMSSDACFRPVGLVNGMTYSKGRQFCQPFHCIENPIYVFPEKELRGLSPNSIIHVYVSDLYIPRIGPHIWLQQNRQTSPGNIADKKQRHYGGINPWIFLSVYYLTRWRQCSEVAINYNQNF